MLPGKLPPDILARLLARLPADPRVLLGPAIGRDAAAIDLGGGRVLIAKTDPVTFAVDQIGRYVVHVNANDIACLGARPSWFLATVLLPEGAAPELAEEIFEQIRSACAELEVVPVGGHTEVTIGLDRPLVSGAMLGETTAEALVRPEAAQAGDHVILTKGIAIEGTALLAREAPGALRAAGVPEETIAAAARLLIEPGISIVRDARAACRAARVHALHDPTEGGLATALRELAEACGLQARVRTADVPVLPETAAVCAALGLDPLGLLASGALLIAMGAADCDVVREALAQEDISAACVGELASGRRGDIMEFESRQPLPRFERDELARWFAAQQRAQG
jgi:hydrogenase maturation factor